MGWAKTFRSPEKSEIFEEYNNILAVLPEESEKIK